MIKISCSANKTSKTLTQNKVCDGNFIHYGAKKFSVQPLPCLVMCQVTPYKTCAIGRPVVFLCTCSWLSALESTKWLQHLSLLLKAALLVVNAVDRDHRPVLVHCSDGWDRTPQIVALSKLLLDPYYRTIEVQNVSDCVSYCRS